MNLFAGQVPLHLIALPLVLIDLEVSDRFHQVALLFLSILELRTTFGSYSSFAHSAGHTYAIFDFSESVSLLLIDFPALSGIDRARDTHCLVILLCFTPDVLLLSCLIRSSKFFQIDITLHRLLIDYCIGRSLSLLSQNIFSLWSGLLCFIVVIEFLALSQVNHRSIHHLTNLLLPFTLTSLVRLSHWL